MTITRRDFLKRAGIATAGTVIMPKLFGGPLVRRAFADTIGDRYMVVLYLDGGNDGLNTVIPIDDAGGLRTAYEAARGTGGGGLRLMPGDMAVPSLAMDDPNTGGALGLHPGLADIASMYDAGNVAVIQGTGYPEYSLSHDTSQVIWETGNPLGVGSLASTGWVGRHLGLEYGPTDIYGVTVSRRLAGEMRANGTSVLTLRDLRRFGFPFDNYSRGDDDEAYGDAFEVIHNDAAGSVEPLTGLLGSSGASTFQSTESYPPLDELYETDRPVFDQAYSDLDRSTADDLREVAKIIYGVSTGQPGVNGRFFQIRNGGYDTHADQGAATGDHFNLHSEVGSAVKLFFEDMADMGLGNKVTMVIWSEFSRRIPQNANGTDHGSQGPMFVIGEPVNGGVYGNHPNIAEAALDDRENTVYSQDNGDGFRSTDFRDVFGTILKHWANMDEAIILSDVLPLDTVGPATEFWQAQNFDMGFL